MIASPSVWGRPDSTAGRVRRTIEYTLGILLGAAVLFTALHGLGTLIGGLPLQVVGVVALVTFVAGRRLPIRRLPQSSWRVPKPESMPRLIYPGVFGAALGVGVITALPAVSFYTVLAAPLAASTLAQALGIAAAFALARAVPMAVVVAGTARRPENIGTAMALRSPRLDRIMHLEPTVLLAIGVLALVLPTVS